MTSGFDQPFLQMKTKIVRSKPVKREVTVQWYFPFYSDTSPFKYSLPEHGMEDWTLHGRQNTAWEAEHSVEERMQDDKNCSKI